jgi:hypothetical protein
LSTGTLIPRHTAELRAARVIVELGLKSHTRDQAPTDLLAVQIVGSIRRHRKAVGDIDLLALEPEVGASTPRITPGMDPLFQVLNQACENPWTDPTAKDTPASLFGGGDRPTPAPPLAPILRAVKGLKPGFKLASLVLLGRGDEPEIPLQVFRSEHAHWGWSLVRCTGPGDLGEELLARWKIMNRIPREGKGSIDGRLVDGYGQVVSTPTEGEFFRRMGLTFCWPRERDEMLKKLQDARAERKSP